jgi:hypothetical protein
VTGHYAYAPDVQVSWDDCLIKYYLNVLPDGTGLNPAKGYHYDQVLILFNPKTKETTITNYLTNGRDPNTGDLIFIDE